jgi:hypothetical protein
MCAGSRRSSGYDRRAPPAEYRQPRSPGMSDHAVPSDRQHLPEPEQPEPRKHPSAGQPGLGRGVSN